MRKLTCFIVIALLSSCIATKAELDSWVGDTKQHLYLKSGYPGQVTEDGVGGQICTYCQTQEWNGGTYYRCASFYIGKDGIIYAWRKFNRNQSPQRVWLR